MTLQTALMCRLVAGMDDGVDLRTCKYLHAYLHANMFIHVLIYRHTYEAYTCICRCVYINIHDRCYLYSGLHALRQDALLDACAPQGRWDAAGTGRAPELHLLEDGVVYRDNSRGILLRHIVYYGRYRSPTMAYSVIWGSK